jgi:tetratricopeptide (TPR) repeat protein
MKTQRRHELQTNALADRIGAFLVWVESNYKTVLGIVVAAIVIVGLYFVLNRNSSAKLERGWNAYYQAAADQNIETMRELAEDHQGTPAGTWARLWVADELLNSGTEQQFQDRSQANDDLRKSVEAYEQVLTQRIDPFLAHRAKLGIARAYESLDQLEEARKYYGELADDDKLTAFIAPQAEKRLTDLERARTKEFYDWFSAQDPKPSIEGGAGQLPFSAPSFDSPLSNEPGTFGSSASKFPDSVDIPTSTDDGKAAAGDPSAADPAAAEQKASPEASSETPPESSEAEPAADAADTPATDPEPTTP